MSRKMTMTKNFSFTEADEELFNKIKEHMQAELDKLGLNNSVKNIDVVRSLMKKYARENGLEGGEADE